MADRPIDLPVDYLSANPVPERSIGDHGIIGNLATAALVARDGTIDFLCWPKLDSPSVFAGLLDPDKGGEFELSPMLERARATQIYLPGTNVLLTKWLATEGSAQVTDLMPYPGPDEASVDLLIRRIKVTRGTVRLRLRCRPRFDYARIVPEVSRTHGGVAFIAGAAGELHLTGSVPLELGDGEATADWTMQAGEEAFLVLGSKASAGIDLEAVDRITTLTISAWRRWTRLCKYQGRWRELVLRSALVLKLLTSSEHGSVAAAATFGLPEAPGGMRNWDYRATWIRDASFTVYAFMRLGYLDEAEAFRRWAMERAEAVSGQLKIMYALDGGDAADEQELPHLAGYGGARPVRIGNAAHSQKQLDIYGELMDSAYLANKYGTGASREEWVSLSAMIEHVRRHWRDPDAGIWELRDVPRELLHSRLMCWVALDRAVRLAEKRSLPAPISAWIQERDEISADIWTNFRHPEHGYFVQSKGGTELDAALLMMPLVRFVSATDPVWLATLDAIRDQLADDSLVYRYRADDGLKGGEGAFTTCSFWYVECLARAGRLDEAQLVMEKGLRYANHLGLFSEELSALAEPLGNFPQALTHLAFISAAYFLDRRLTDPTGGLWQP